MSETVIKSEVVCAPVLTFTQSDANHASSLCPVQLVKDKQNILYVMAAIDKSMIESHIGKLFVIHHVRDEDNQNGAIAGEW